MIEQTKLGIKFLALKFQNKKADSTRDYDIASKDYDSFFSKTMGKYSRNMLNMMEIRENSNVVELACGTGYLTEKICEYIGENGTLSVVDQSEGMLNVAKSKVGDFKNLIIEKNDMMSFLGNIPDFSVDAVVCGWAICYVNPVTLLKEIHRILKPNGKVGIIETRYDSEKVIMDAFNTVVGKETSFLKKYIELNLPKNSVNLNKWFSESRLETINCWEGEEIIPCKNGEDAIEWVFRSGACAGFIDVIDRSREDELRLKIKDLLDYKIQTDMEFKLSHTYVAGIAIKK